MAVCARPLRLLDLPDDALRRVLSACGSRWVGRLRSSCRRLRAIDRGQLDALGPLACPKLPGWLCAQKLARAPPQVLQWASDLDVWIVDTDFQQRSGWAAVCRFAALDGRRPTLEWAARSGQLHHGSASEGAVARGDRQLLTWLVRVLRDAPRAGAWVAAAHRTRPDFFDLLRELGAAWNPEAAYTAAHNTRSAQLVLWADRAGMDFDRRFAVTLAADVRRWDVVHEMRAFLQGQPQMGPRLVRCAVLQDDVGQLRWLHNALHAHSPPDALVLAASFGHLDTVRWLAQNEEPPQPQQVIDAVCAALQEPSADGEHHDPHIVASWLAGQWSDQDDEDPEGTHLRVMRWRSDGLEPPTLEEVVVALDVALHMGDVWSALSLSEEWSSP